MSHAARPFDLALVDRSPGETRVALLREDVLWDYAVFRDHLPAPGDIYLGRVTGTLAGRTAVLVNIGASREGFLAAEDCPQGLPAEGAAVAVQVTIAPRHDKGAKLTASLSLNTPLLAWSPGRPGVSLSSRITHKASRQRLMAWATTAVRPEEGVVVRTEAREADELALEDSLALLRRQWAAIDQAAHRGTPPACLLAASSPLEAVLAGRQVESIRCCGSEALAIARASCPPLSGLMRQCDPRLWDEEGIDEAVSEALETTLPLPRGGAVHFEPTAAVVAIDVDSGGLPAEEANSLAVPLIARQIMVRGLAGMLVIDFAAPRRGAEAHKRQLAQQLASALAVDPAHPQVLGVSALGLVELRRSRRRTPLADSLCTPGGQPSAETAALAACRALLKDVPAAPGLRPLLRVSPAVDKALRGPLAAAWAETRRRLAFSPEVRVDPAAKGFSLG